MEETNKGSRKESKTTYDISTSCVLVSDEDEVSSPTDEFSLGLEMSFNGSVEDLYVPVVSAAHSQNGTPQLSEGGGSSRVHQNPRLSQDLAAVHDNHDNESPKIGSFTLPFLFPASIEDVDEVMTSDRDSILVCPCLSSLKDSLLMGRELVAMAQARQSPIMLLSTSTNLVRTHVWSTFL